MTTFYAKHTWTTKEVRKDTIFMTISYCTLKQKNNMVYLTVHEAN